MLDRRRHGRSLDELATPSRTGADARPVCLGRAWEALASDYNPTRSLSSHDRAPVRPMSLGERGGNRLPTFRGYVRERTNRSKVLIRRGFVPSSARECPRLPPLNFTRNDGVGSSDRSRTPSIVSQRVTPEVVQCVDAWWRGDYRSAAGC